MKIRMLQTVEDSHGFVTTADNGKKGIAYDVRKFYEGQVYDETNGGPDFNTRAEGLIALGYAEAV